MKRCMFGRAYFSISAVDMAIRILIPNPNLKKKSIGSMPSTDSKCSLEVNAAQA